MSLRIYFAISVKLLIFLVILGCSIHESLYDERIKRLLDKENLSYEIDQDGDFKVSVPLLGEEKTSHVHENVWIISYLKTLNDLDVRELFSLSIKLPSSLPSSLLESLMADSYNNRFLGSWVILDWKQENRYLAYLAKLPTGDLNSKNLMQILQEVAETSYAMREVLSTSVISLQQ